MALTRNVIWWSVLLALLACWGCERRIDRQQVVSRHTITHTRIDPLSALSVGNGAFAFTTDITGLQTFPDFYEKGIPLGTMAQWGWHSFPNPQGYCLKDTVRQYRVGERTVPYFYQFSDDANERKNNATNWLRENPHRLHLGLVGLEMLKRDGTKVLPTDIEHPRQQLDLWTGELHSSFTVDGVEVRLTTLCHQEQDRVAFRIESALLPAGQLSIKLSFGYARHEKFSSGYDLSSPDRHTTRVIEHSSSSACLLRKLDDTEYFVTLDWDGQAQLVNTAPHQYLLQPSHDCSVLDASILFSATRSAEPTPSFVETQASSQQGWRRFWESGGAVDFAHSSDPRACELERRVVLSQYLTKIQCSGSLPPAETGLTYNSWHGKFHLEMHWWHLVHFLLWQRPELVEEQLGYYFTILEAARETAALQGYRGVRWPKMTGPQGRESPSSIGTFLIWQQPHVISYAELLYRLQGYDPAVLQRYRELVFASAEFMASYARFDENRGEYVLGPALIPAQERFEPEETVNPAFELAYWSWGLRTAQQWRRRLGLPEHPQWQRVLDNLAPLPVQDERYLFVETAQDSYTNPRSLSDHPMVLGVSGFVPRTDMVDDTILENTFTAVIQRWRWDTCWGWDFPLASLTAAALGHPETAIDLLLMDTPKNTYLANGHNYQDETLRCYLPGNGGVLTAVAELCAPRGEQGRNAFAQAPRWTVQCEGIHGLR